ncbi:hypothetical protein MPLDJ20_220044 [Mesorhizobium plurifarium]|uniref:Uncharacterized protein n=1 Tax=Mesorhizobium plurifarium TaxID=69974 RepID=A0A090F2H2_MESPL|nr:hypothetical protein MPLDJ20_220044 [Mesorhizobium plurifarium]
MAKYEERLTDNLRDLCERVHTGRYRPQPVRRAYIPKGDGGKRPLGVPALEDNRPRRGGRGAECCLRGRVPGVFLRLPAGAEPPHGAGCPAYGDHEPACELGARCRHSQLLRLGRPRVAAADGGAQDR